MSFRVTARTVLQLGAELISSDSIAFYELIKNAFDADSQRVDIDVCVRIDHSAYLSHIRAISGNAPESTSNLENHRARIQQDVDTSVPGADALLAKLKGAQSFGMLSQCLEEANYIQIQDQGHGMSADDLDDIYLTIGTPNRRMQRIKQSKSISSDGHDGGSLRPILGEKGLGRLSAMRLGWRLDVSTTTKGEKRQNQLNIDWRQFLDQNLLVGDVTVSPINGRLKEDPNASGTRVRILALASPWSSEKLQTIARDEFSKLTDPFVPAARYPINVRYNGQPVQIARFDDILFSFAHASAEAKFTVGEEGPRFAGRFQHRMTNRETTFLLDKTHLFSITKQSPPNVLESLGPFSVRFYWYNRRILSAIDGIGDRQAVRKLVNAWAGGLMVYRDGFRVNPYGSRDDDWLDLDKQALASSGYKVNRHQIIGVVSISSFTNQALVDQTNREGLRDCPEKQVLVALLQQMVASEFRDFLNAVDNEAQAQLPSSFEDLDQRVENEERSIRRNLRLLLERYPEIGKDRELVEPINAAIGRLRLLMDEASRLAESYEAGHSELTNLAGIGLMVEIVAHELNRATSHALVVIADAGQHDLDGETASLFQTLGAQMHTLQRRLRILDPLSTAGRQRKERFDLVAWVSHILEGHSAQFSRDDVAVDVRVVPASSSSTLRVYMVKGMFVQIIENLLSNSMYWLKIERRMDPSFMPNIQIVLDTSKRLLILSDNGPGIPVDRREQVFQPFFTTKPPGEGHGLGLYVSREVARYNGADLSLADEETVHEGRLNTFLLHLGVD